MMALATSKQVLAVLLGTAAGLVESAFGLAEGLPPWVVFPLAIATCGVAFAAALALDAMARRSQRPDKKDVIELRDLQRHNHKSLGEYGQRISRTEAQLFQIAIELDLTRAEHELAYAAERVETWDRLSHDLLRWNSATEFWREVVTRLGADLVPEAGSATDDEVRAARAALPPAHNFSSQDLKGAIAYLVERKRILVADERIVDRRRALATSAHENRTGPSS